LDGELVAGAGTLSDFYRLGPALAIRRRAGSEVSFVAFDLLGWMVSGLPDGHMPSGANCSKDSNFLPVALRPCRHSMDWTPPCYSRPVTALAQKSWC
jgi:hypothetical protein